MPNSLKIGIADIIISIEGADIPTIPPAYRPFICSGKSDIRLRLHRRRPHLPAAEKIFSCSPIWHLYRHRDLSIVKIFEELDVPGSTLVFSDQLQTVDLYPSDQSPRQPDPFDGPILELLMINYLALEKGVVIHACGVEKDGLGLLFAGESGAGKKYPGAALERSRCGAGSQRRPHSSFAKKTVNFGCTAPPGTGRPNSDRRAVSNWDTAFS